MSIHSPSLRFAHRSDAGRQLASAVQQCLSGETRPLLVLALPRGGVPVAGEIARTLEAPLDVLLVRKLPAPGQPELGLGAVVEGSPPQTVLNHALVQATGASPAYIAAQHEEQLQLIEARRRLYREGAPAAPVAGRVVVLVDDGIATGGTMQAALQGLAQLGAARTVVAVPVAPAGMGDRLGLAPQDYVCLQEPARFNSVGEHYLDFEQTSDEEVMALLRRPTSP
ncbi:phosphoribosyltransferase [Ideonella sp. BN130291]|uniref:phosphoribosyltransferase n=1 Tax=Ideonella sp. BN130291 TaxID=3112940 RepID=UPI002E25BCA6|nr:phosphoribosyltransferase family protein [Ideonella sp. BN130291]